MRTKKHNIVSITLSFLLFTYFLFANALETLLPVIKQLYLDEMLLIVMVAVITLTQWRIKKNLHISEYIILGCYLFLIGIGLFGNFLYGYQGYKIFMLDILLLSKFMISYFYGRICFSSEYMNELLPSLYRYVQILSVGLFSALVLNILFSIWPSGETRFFFPIQNLFFSHSTYLTSVVVFCLLIFLIKRKKIDFIFISFNLVLIFAAGRNKGFIFLGIFLLVFILQSFGKKVNMLAFFSGGIVLYLVFQNVIAERLLSSETSARYVLYSKSFELAAKYFPIGAGFGTFGSKASLINYSPLYNELGFTKIFGFTELDSNYLTDSFFAMIIGQFGILGLSLIGIIFVLFFRLLTRSKNYLEFKLVLFAYILLSMITENFISSTFGMFVFLLIGMLVGESIQQKNEIGDERRLEEMVSFKKIGGVLRKKCKMIILSVVISALFGAGVSTFILTPEYKSTIQVIASQDFDSQIMQNTEVQANIQLVSTYNEIIKSPFILEKVSEEMDGLYSVAELMKMIQVRNETNSQIINISMVSEDSKVAAKLVTLTAKTFQEYGSSIMKIKDITIISKSKYNTVSTRRHPAVYVLIASVCGLFFGIVLAFILSMLDTTLKNEEDIYTNLALPLLGSIGKIEYKNETTKIRGSKNKRKKEKN